MVVHDTSILGLGILSIMAFFLQILPVELFLYASWSFLVPIPLLTVLSSRFQCAPPPSLSTFKCVLQLGSWLFFLDIFEAVICR